MPGIRREAFEKSGIHKLSNRSDFFTRLEECKAFISSKGRIPNKNSTDEFERSLHHWRLDQMKSHNLGRIKGHRLELLLQSGVLESSYILEWRSFYDRLKAFVNTHGRLPLRSSPDPEESQLGKWRQVQYSLYKSGKQSNDKASLLEEIGSNITVDDENWDRTFHSLQDFIKKNGLIPSRRSDSLKERNLYQWLRTQRRYLKSNTLSPRRKALLNSLEIPGKGRLDVQWDTMLEQVQAFVNRHGRLPSKDDPKNKKECTLRGWCSRQRRLNKSGKLNPERMKPLEDLGLFRNRWNDIWLAHYKEVYQYLRKNGKLPEHDTIDPVERQLGRWCECQKKEYARNKLSKERITLLRTAGII